MHGIPSLDGLDFEFPHRKMMPFVVEGYHLPDQDFQAKDLLPKGIEIRTPVCRSIDECFDVQRLLLSRLTQECGKEGYGLLSLSHHPDHHHFSGPQNKRRHDFWQWAMEVMTTYGPDINVGVPDEIWIKLDQADLLAKINYYGPALTALSVRSPFRNGEPWRIRGKVGKSLRVFRRSVVAPPIEVHPHENRRLEFKVFDMTSSFAELEGYFLLFLTLLLDPALKGRASQATRIYDSGAVAVEGFQADTVVARLGEIFDSAELTLPKWGFPAWGLGPLIERFDTRRTPADDLLDRYHELGDSMPALLRDMNRELEMSCREPASLVYASA